MCQASNVEKDIKKIRNYYYIGCNFKSFVTIKCGDSSCNNWLHHICQNEYDCAKYDNAFDTMNSYQKRCRICVDKTMDKFTKSVVTEDKKITKSYVIEEKHIHRLLDNRSCNPIDISDGNEEIDDVESNVVPDVKINEFSEETTDVICLDKNNEVLQN